MTPCSCVKRWGLAGRPSSRPGCLAWESPMPMAGCATTRRRGCSTRSAPSRPWAGARHDGLEYAMKRRVRPGAQEATPVTRDAWAAWRSATPARVALGRAGSGMPTDEVLRFGLAHAMARDAIHVPLDVDALAADLAGRGWGV